MCMHTHTHLYVHRLFFRFFSLFHLFLKFQLNSQILYNPFNSQDFYTISKKQYCCSVAKLCPTLCDPRDCSTPGFPLLHTVQNMIPFNILENMVYPSVRTMNSCKSKIPFYTICTNISGICQIYKNYLVHLKVIFK